MKAIHVDYVSNLACRWAYAVRFFSGTLCARETMQRCERNADMAKKVETIRSVVIIPHKTRWWREAFELWRSSSATSSHQARNRHRLTVDQI